MRAVLWLVKNGIPYDVAMSLSQLEIQAYSIIFSEQNLPKEQHFNFELMRFMEPKNHV